ncbi:hypothetical protein EYF80_047218 [Liparis tanakae]|uniref:Uncharacterized protein n=1 Tax=Liparis tanakae TaxID=230148 RepID=A0A4Z2FMX7_9TELE|nr:hypothetical protein EYF80_047218 [Liparis tanakae]
MGDPTGHGGPTGPCGPNGPWGSQRETAGVTGGPSCFYTFDLSLLRNSHFLPDNEHSCTHLARGVQRTVTPHLSTQTGPVTPTGPPDGSGRPPGERSARGPIADV